MSDLWAGVGGDGSIPPYTQPALSVRATWEAPDGSRPGEVIVEWKEPPPIADVLDVLGQLAPAQVWVTQQELDAQALETLGEEYTPETRMEQLRRAGARMTPTEGVFPHPVRRAADLQDVGEPVTGDPEDTICPAKLDLGEQGTFAHSHACMLERGHDPVEPDGRQHRCHCGGMFATEAETPQVTGNRRRERDR